MKLENNTILITGGTSGIGLGLAKRLAPNNQIIVLGRNLSKLQTTVKENPNFDTYQADVSDMTILAGLPDWIQMHHPSLNIIINSAGIMRTYDLFDESITPTDLVADIQTNLVGTIAVDKLLLNHLVKQKEAMIVNVSSGLDNLSSAAHPTYSASKAGVHMFTDALREQLAYAHRDHVHVMELVPPLVAETNLEMSTTLANTSSNMKLTDLIAATVDGMKKDAIRVNPGYAKLMRKAGQIAPDTAEHQLAKQMLPIYFPDGLK